MVARGSVRGPGGRLGAAAAAAVLTFLCVVLVPVVPPAWAGDLPGRWSSIAPIPITGQAASLTVTGGALHLFGGQKRLDRGEFVPRADHLWYDAAAGTWHRGPRLLVPTSHAQAVTVGGRAYVIGGLQGWPGPDVAAVQIFDPARGTWSRGQPMPRPRGSGGVAAGPDGRIWYAGGIADGRVVPWVDVYDPAADTWRRGPDMPRALDHFQAVVLNGRLHVVGGRARYAHRIVQDHLALDLRRLTWADDLPPPPRPAASYGAVALAGELLLFGGEDRDPNRAYATAFAYDPAVRRWRSLTNMPRPRHDFGAAVCRGAVYLVGGSTSGGELHPTRAVDVVSFGAPPAPCR